MMDIAIDIAIILCVAVALVLAILRIREQNRLKKATNRLVRSYSEFDSVLDKVSDYIGIDNDKSSVPATNYMVHWYNPDVSRGRVHYVTCTVHQRPPTIVPSADDLWMRVASDRTIAEKFLKECNPEATWIFQDESEYEPALR